jgi:2-polyprenyl-6-methoxyphenol hydroxylase-like FAD-dependent oxidoreductase
MPQRTGKAIVIGSGMAGLMAARVLSAFFAEVEILERDPPVTTTEARAGAPQGHQIHALLLRGQRILEALLPGFEADILKAGAQKAKDAGRDQKIFAFGRWTPAVEFGFAPLTMTRGLLEFVVRERVGRIANVRFRYDTTADELVFDKAAQRVTGVVAREGGEAQKTIAADFVVDAAGRGAFAVRAFKSLGFATPKEEIIGLDFGYATARFDIPAGFKADWATLFVQADPPRSDGAFFLPIEGNRWLVAAFGRGKNKPPAQRDGFMEFTRRLPHTLLYECIKDARLTGEIKPHRFPSSVRRRFDLLADHPEGFLAIGDAHCSLNPFFAQGMSVAAMEAEALERRLRTATAGGPAFDGLWRGFYQDLRDIVATPWSQTLLIDSLYDETQMPRPFGFALHRRIALWAQALMLFDPELCVRFFKAVHFVAGPKDKIGPLDLLAAQFREWRKGRRSAPTPAFARARAPAAAE